MKTRVPLKMGLRARKVRGFRKNLPFSGKIRRAQVGFRKIKSLQDQLVLSVLQPYIVEHFLL